jgi:hypothetical protein
MSSTSVHISQRCRNLILIDSAIDGHRSDIQQMSAEIEILQQKLGWISKVPGSPAYELFRKLKNSIGQLEFLLIFRLNFL